MSTLEITDPAGDPLGALEVTAERGTPSSHIPIRIFNPGGSTISGALVTMFAEKTPGSGSYADSGHPATDERQGRFQVTGVDSSGTAGQTVSDASEQSLGYLKQAVLPPILPLDAILADIWIAQPSTSAGGGAVKIKLTIDNDSPARPVGPGVTDVARGIVPGTNTPESFLIAGRALTATGTPDDQVHVAAGSWLFQGVEGTDASASAITLNQNDVAAAALTTGEAYIAAISQGLSNTPTTTKGAKGTTPDYPVVPIGEVLLGFVTVHYHATASVIVTGDIELNDLTYGRYLVTHPATGLAATVHTGRALTADYMQRRDVKGDVVLINSATNRIWLEANGQITVTSTVDQPSPGALLLATETTSGGNVTGSTDERVYIGGAGSLSLHAITHHTGGTDALAAHDIDALSTADGALLAPLADPVFTGDPTGPTPTAGDDSPSLATTAFVQAAIAALFTDHFLEFVGDSSSQPATLSPVPATGSIVLVDVNGKIVRAGIGKDYTDDGVGNIVFTPVLDNTQIAGLHWRG